jgi:hypothetical protein
MGSADASTPQDVALLRVLVESLAEREREMGVTDLLLWVLEAITLRAAARLRAHRRAAGSAGLQAVPVAAALGHQTPAGTGISPCAA